MGLNSEHVLDALRPAGWMVFDLETAPMPGAADYLTEPIEAPSNYKDPLKIDAYIKDKRQKQLDEAGLDIDLCEVVAIGGACEDTEWVSTREKHSETQMIRAFWQFASDILSKNGSLIGFNVLFFDLPVLLRRSLYLGITAPRISIDKYRHDGIVDVADTLSFSRRDLLRSLGFYAKRLGIEHDETTDGSQIAGLVAKGEWAAVQRHCQMDVRTTKDIAVRLGLIHGVRVPVVVPDHGHAVEVL